MIRKKEYMDKATGFWEEAAVRDFLGQEVSDWDDELCCRARFKGFSGQRSDWQPVLGFWRDLIVRVCLRFDVLFITHALLRDRWFSRAGLAPLCLRQVLAVMLREDGSLLRARDLPDPTPTPTSTVSLLLRKLAANFITADDHQFDDDDDALLAVVPVLNDRAARLVTLLSQTHWTDCAVLTMPTFHRICGPEAASAVLSHLCAQRTARCLSLSTPDPIQGVKVSLSPSPVSCVSSLDGTVLHLIWTTEMLQQQLSIIQQRAEKSRKSALASLNSGNKNIALRHMRAFKLANESREKCDNLLSRVEQVLNVIASAESTKKVSEAIQIGAQAIKENKISAEEVEHSLQELEESINLQKEVENALESASPYTYVEDEDVEEEFKKLELEIEGGNCHRPTPEGEKESADSLTDAFSKLKVVDGSSTTPAGHNVTAKETKHLELEAS